MRQLSYSKVPIQYSIDGCLKNIAKVPEDEHKMFLSNSGTGNSTTFHHLIANSLGAEYFVITKKLGYKMFLEADEVEIKTPLQVPLRETSSRVITALHPCFKWRIVMK